MWKPGQQVKVKGTDDTPAGTATIVRRHDVDGEPGYIVLYPCGLRDLVHEELICKVCSQESQDQRLENPSNAAVLSYIAGREVQWKGYGGYQDGDTKLGRNSDAARKELGITKAQFEAAKDELRRGIVAPLPRPSTASTKTKKATKESTRTPSKKTTKTTKVTKASTKVSTRSPSKKAKAPTKDTTSDSTVAALAAIDAAFNQTLAEVR